MTLHTWVSKWVKHVQSVICHIHTETNPNMQCIPNKIYCNTKWTQKNTARFDHLLWDPARKWNGLTVKVADTHTHPLNSPLSRTARVGQYQKGETNLDFTEARASEWQWHQLGHMQVCISLQTDNHVSTPPLSFLQAGCPFCRPTNSVKALKAIAK